MTTPFWCLLIAAVLPYVLAIVGAKFRIDQLGTLDNNHPRVQANQLRDVAAQSTTVVAAGPSLDHPHLSSDGISWLTANGMATATSTCSPRTSSWTAVWGCDS